MNETIKWDYCLLYLQLRILFKCIYRSKDQFYFYIPPHTHSQSILKEINTEYSLEGLMLKLQYFGYLMQRADSLKKTLMLGKTVARGEEGDRG